MKKTAIALLVVLSAAWIAAPSSASERNRGELNAIRKAVAEAPDPEPAGAPHWFKLVVTDDRCHKDVVRLSLPIGLCELFLGKCRDTRVKLDRCLSEINLAEIWSELKRDVPHTVIEVSSGKETVKIWFE
ncbi:MAG: hypothetical protein ABSA30_04265 [Candidatus Aminicenantales bacterium]|jgi:hypothetical protein